MPPVSVACITPSWVCGNNRSSSPCCLATGFLTVRHSCVTEETTRVLGPYALANVISQLDMQLDRLNCHAKQNILSSIVTSRVAVLKSPKQTKEMLCELDNFAYAGAI